MCLAVPAKVVALQEAEQAVVDLDGVRQTISLAMVDDVAVGDYVIVHVGFALQKLNVQEAEVTLALLREIGATASSVAGAAP